MLVVCYASDDSALYRQHASESIKIISAELRGIPFYVHIQKKKYHCSIHVKYELNLLLDASEKLGGK